jgi:hypothetical protein
VGGKNSEEGNGEEKEGIPPEVIPKGERPIGKRSGEVIADVEEKTHPRAKQDCDDIEEPGKKPFHNFTRG